MERHDEGDEGAGLAAQGHCGPEDRREHGNDGRRHAEEHDPLVVAPSVETLDCLLLHTNRLHELFPAQLVEDSLGSGVRVGGMCGLAFLPDFLDVVAFVAIPLSRLKGVFGVTVVHEDDRNKERYGEQRQRAGDAPPKLACRFRHERDDVPYEHDGHGQLQEHRREQPRVVDGLQACVERDAMRRYLPQPLEDLGCREPDELREEDRDNVAQVAEHRVADEALTLVQDVAVGTFHLVEHDHVGNERESARPGVLLELMGEHSHPAEDEEHLHVAKGRAAPKSHDECEDDEYDATNVVPVPLPEHHRRTLLWIDC